MGIVKISDDLHDYLRRASQVMSRSINSQAEFWIKIGIQAELNPDKTFTTLISEMLEKKLLTIKGSTMSNITIKTAEEIELMRESGRLLAKVFAMLDTFIVPGITTMEINDKVEDYIVNELQARPASKGQYGYQYVLNTSLNEVVCHGVPKADEHLKARDIINVDITLEKNGFIADSSKMYVMPEASPLARKLVKDTYEAMWEGIKQVKPGATLGDIGSAIQHHAEKMVIAWFVNIVVMV